MAKVAVILLRDKIKARLSEGQIKKAGTTPPSGRSDFHLAVEYHLNLPQPDVVTRIKVKTNVAISPCRENDKSYRAE